MTRTLRTNNRNAVHAKELLQHYFRMIAEESGIKWRGEMAAEVGTIVDSLLLAMWDEIENEAEYQAQETAGDVDEDVTVTFTGDACPTCGSSLLRDPGGVACPKCGYYTAQPASMTDAEVNRLRNETLRSQRDAILANRQAQE